ncbi:MAG TPA: peptidase M23 [Betaproteobacteria bacterium]|nr:peptidase M23 [Betaproteobacteria bacterium]
MQKQRIGILARNLRLNDRKIPLWRFIAFSGFPLFGVVAALDVAPPAETQSAPIHRVTQMLTLPQPAKPTGEAASFWRQGKIRRGDTIATLLARIDVNTKDILGFLRSANKAKSLHQLLPGKVVEAQTTGDGKLLALRYIANGNMMLVSERKNDAFQTMEQAIPTETRVIMRSAVINHSLFGATDGAGIPDSIALQLADIFSSAIDFHLDLRKGDRFSVIYESAYHDGAPVHAGRILAAEFVNRGKRYRAIYFQDHAGRKGYFTQNGRNVRKAFLRSPLEFSRISSGFSLARFHPILKKWRAHKGVDYAAPMGTRVKATGDGVVAFAGVRRGYGNVILLRHRGGYVTVYGHLRGFAKGVRKGATVAQGEVIGYVGMTGMATGPHLHYEFRIAGIQRNPLTISLPASFPLAAQDKARFSQLSRPYRVKLDLLHSTNLATLE